VLDWQRAFAFDTPPLEIVLRGTVVYLGLFFLLRVVLKRQSGTTGITDLLVIVLLADASQNAMSANYTSISDGMVLVVTIVAWSYALDYAAFRFPRVAKVIHPKPLPLVKDGVLLRRNMRRELITEDDLRAQLRQQGIEDVDSVKAVYMEGDGHFSIVTGQHRPLTGKERQRL
jgi:uncharacterized membrane protein YcaP (DUF421 family)